MYTQCPECLTIFEIDEDALQASLGIVHCGHCAKRFDALRTLSDTLPAEPSAVLVEQDPVAPTLTEAVPPSAFGFTATEWASGSDVALVPEARKSSAAESSDEPTAGEKPPPETDRAPRGESTNDWFADLETELTPSLIADATGVSRLQADYTWQVSDLSTWSRFPAREIPVTFAGSGTGDADRTAAPEPRGTPAGEAVAAATGEEPDADTPVAPPEIAVPFDETHSPDVEGPGKAVSHEALPLWPDEIDIDTPNLDDLVPDNAEPEVVEPDNGASSTSIPLPLEVADSNAAELPDAAVAEPDSSRSVAESDPSPSSTPVYLRPRRRRAAGVAWVLGCLLLALALAAQTAWIKRVELFRNPATHPWAARVCQVIACRLPPIRDVAKLELLSRDVRPDPHAAGALMITTTVRNNATFRQPWPVVAVELTDVDNNPVAMRRFRPAEYMPDPARRAAGIAPGATAAIAFEVADAGKRAVGFQFSFQ